jgi:hypothetical protein
MKLLKTIIPWILTILLFVFLFSRIPVDQVIDTLANARWGLYLAILIPYSCLYLLLDAGAVTVAVRRFHAKVRYREMIPVRAVTYVLSLVNHNVAQGGLALWLWRKEKIPFLAIAGTMIFLAFIEISDLILVSSLGAAMAGTSVPGLREAYFVLYAVLAGILFYFRGLKLLGIPRPAPGLLSTFDRARIVDYLAVLAFKATALFLAAVLNWVAVGFFGMDIPFFVVLANLPLIYLASAVPLTVAKLGTAQAAWVFLLGEYAPEANLLAYSLCAHLMFLVTNALLGVCFLPLKGREIWDLAQRREELLAEAGAESRTGQEGRATPDTTRARTAAPDEEKQEPG